MAVAATGETTMDAAPVAIFHRAVARSSWSSGCGREILEGKHVAGGERDDGLGIAGGGEFAEAAEDGNELFDGAIVVDDEDERASGGR